jgi:hypothetical protein
MFFVELCVLRRAPQDLPASSALFATVVGASILVGLMVGLLAGLAFGVSLIQTIVEIALTLLALLLALRLTRRGARFLQAATALLGSGAVIGVVAMLPLSLNPMASEESELAAFGALLLFLLFVWSVVVSGHILRHTLQITLGQGAAISVAFKIGLVLLVGSLFATA